MERPMSQSALRPPPTPRRVSNLTSTVSEAVSTPIHAERDSTTPMSDAEESRSPTDDSYPSFPSLDQAGDYDTLSEDAASVRESVLFSPQDEIRTHPFGITVPSSPITHTSSSASASATSVTTGRSRWSGRPMGIPDEDVESTIGRAARESVCFLVGLKMSKIDIQ